jgi:hypothetical protein
MLSANIIVSDYMSLDLWLLPDRVYCERPLRNATIRETPGFYCVNIFPYKRLFCKFTVYNTLLPHNLKMIVRSRSAISSDSNKTADMLLCCKKSGVYNAKYKQYFGRVVWDINSMLNGCNYGDLECCLFMSN